MAPIKINRIISVDNEDPKYPASNLLKIGGTGCWKCKSSEEKKAVLILELSENSVINSVDIGNENSAFIEILVAKSADPDRYQVLIIATPLMSLQESRSGINKNGVKFLKSDQLHKPVADESWDRVKIICSQPFVNNAQFGLAFITFHSKTEVSDKTANKSINLGKFRLKAADDSDISVGSVFQKRNDPLCSVAAVSSSSLHTLTPGRLSINNKIQNSFKSTTNNDSNDKKKRKIDASQTNVSASNRKATGGPLLYDDSDDSSVTNQSNNNDSSTPSKKTKRSDANNGPSRTSAVNINNQSSAGSGPSINSSTSNKRNSLTANKKIVQNEPKRKPFNKLFENVAFVLSGYQNPYRAELRSKALQMGAKYKADWDRTCTHLICAFMNTPKYHQVRGNGRIVRKDWIEDSYNQRKRLPWKVYALNKNDVSDSDSDEEILEQTQDQQVGNRVVEQMDEDEENLRETTCVENGSGDFGSNTEDELERVRNRQKKDLKPNIYDAETDVEDDSEDENEKNETYGPMNSKDGGPSDVPTFFEYIQFYLDENLPKSTKKKLRKFIELHSGSLTNNIGEAHYVVSEVMKSDKDESYKIVKPQWVLEFNAVLAT